MLFFLLLMLFRQLSELSFNSSLQVTVRVLGVLLHVTVERRFLGR